MPYLIDGNNLIGSSPDISLNDPEARKKLIEIVRKFQQSKNCTVIIFFDGEPDGLSYLRSVTAKFTVQFPRYGQSADEEIKRVLNSYQHFRDVILVSSDRELKDFARHKGARTINSGEFHSELKKYSRVHKKKQKKNERINTRLSKREVDQWLKIFGDKDS